MNAQHLVFIDESGVNTRMMRSHARAPRGQRALDHQRVARGPNYTLIGALTKDGILASHLLDGSMRKAEFLRYLKDELLPKLTKGSVVVMDNLRIHHCAEAKALAQGCGISFAFVPPYSPRFNPIEEAWSKLKAFLRKTRARLTDTLVEAVRTGLKNITSSDAHGWIRHAGYSFPQGSS
jgi:transposase